MPPILKSRWKFTFRAMFIGSVVTLITVTAALVGATSYRNARFAADDLSGQVLEQTSARVDGEIQKLVTKAVDETEIAQRLISADRLHGEAFPEMVDYWLQTMAVDRDLSSQFIGLQSTGESVGVSRLQGKLSIWQSHFNPDTKAFEERDFWPEDYPNKPYGAVKPAPDIRTRPWYIAAREAHHPIWTETYAFLGVGNMTDVQGVTYASPMYDKADALTGVVTADFDLKELCAFLQTLHIGHSGFAFVIERRANGTERLIAHPNATLLQPTKSGANGSIGEGRVTALMNARPPAATEFSFLHFTRNGQRYLGGYRPLSGANAPPWSIGIMEPEADVLERVNRGNFVSAAIAVAGLLFGVFLGIYFARQVARPLEKLSDEMNAIAQLRLEARPVIHSIVSEVALVAVATEEIKTGLRQKRILEKYVPRGARDEIQHNQVGNIALGGARVRRTILFSDIRGFTSMSERLSPDAVVALLNTYLLAMTAVILEHGGDINEYIGDAILAVFKDSTDALAAAAAMQHALVKLCAETGDVNLRDLRMGIGLHAGDVVEGNIGTTERVKFGVIGDTVNLAARIQDRSRDGKHTCVLVSQVVHDETNASFEFDLMGDLAMKGKSAPVRVFEMMKARS